MSTLKLYKGADFIDFFIRKGKEGEYWDFKQEWHERIEDLIKDIICFSNTVHNEDCYLIFGISDNLEIVGMRKNRRKQADIIDAISKLHFAGDNYPKVEVDTILYDNIELDVLIIYNTDKTPIYLKNHYGRMKAGCIYVRNGDRNTQNDGNADIDEIENLWKKRLGLTKSHLDYIYDRLENKLEWVENDNYFYNIYRPEYTLQKEYDEIDRPIDEFYSYAMTNESTAFGLLNIYYNFTKLKSFQIVELDARRLSIPTPTPGFIYRDIFQHNFYSYRYYIVNDNKYRLLNFLYDESNPEQNHALRCLQNVVLLYISNEERIQFENYAMENIKDIEKQLQETEDYHYIKTETNKKTQVYKERLRVGIILNKLLKSWRNIT